ncbi:uncharacterized protein BYT42DRAFT_621858 [Radiomyces spectabilis]|uniref:uncharacterized protein n=1 Tax=Radiomyces spectabilis TaxID=64574 RepID=UPI002220F96E|nr:uncharacterized protein BYT42DRAFT_621858 [Radiomyces spectabilis]KAI8373111.1 hypothetical protein BYT42DRAFT_621858 [Radiomyces spectabilis]
MSAACERTADGAGDDTSLLSRPFETLTQMDDIRKSLRLLDEEETRIDKSLDDMLAQEAELEDVLGILDVLRPQLGNLKIEASHLVNTIQDTSHLAENISDKVRKLDQEQSRTKEAIQFVEGVQELKHCVAGIQYAIQRKNYDEAASLLQRASRIDNTILNSSLAEFTTVR